MARSKGFTLIEVMVAVAVIGILAAIAIANYSTYESKARQGEAKIALSSIYSLQRSFHAEWTAFMEDFRAIGYTPEGFKRHYTIGWKSPADPLSVTGYSGGVGLNFYEYENVPTSWGYTLSGTPVCTKTVAFAGLSNAVSGADVNPQTFLVKARGVLRLGIDCDEWEIDEQKNLKNTIQKL
jgi:prepilin-type N-terminal cleavage/methylation domain-containing protein